MRLLPCIDLLVMPLICTAALVLFATPLAARALTLPQAVERALEANPSLEAKLKSLEQAKMNVGVAQSYFWPRVSLIASTSRLKNQGDIGTAEDLSNTTDTQGLRLTLSLFAGFAHLNSLQKSLINVEVAKEQQRQARLELVSNVQLQFLQLLKAREDLKHVKKSIKRIETQIQAAEAFFKVGMAPYLNVMQNKVELSKARQSEIRVNNTIRGCIVQLNQYLGFTPDERVEYTGDLAAYGQGVDYNEEQAVMVAMKRRPDLNIARRSIEVALKDSQITAGQYLPKADLSYDNRKFKRDYEDERFKDYSRDYWSVTLNFNWEIFSGGQTTFQFIGDRKKVQSLAKNYENAMSSAKTDVIKALLDIRAAKELIAASRLGVEAAQESYAMASKRYATNIGTITELLDAQSRLTEAEASVSQALMEYQGARSKFYVFIGEENESLK